MVFISVCSGVWCLVVIIILVFVVVRVMVKWWFRLLEVLVIRVWCLLRVNSWVRFGCISGFLGVGWVVFLLGLCGVFCLGCYRCGMGECCGRFVLLWCFWLFCVCLVFGCNDWLFVIMFWCWLFWLCWSWYWFVGFGWVFRCSVILLGVLCVGLLCCWLVWSLYFGVCLVVCWRCCGCVYSCRWCCGCDVWCLVSVCSG